jgi:hypothetical protein
LIETKPTEVLEAFGLTLSLVEWWGALSDRLIPTKPSHIDSSATSANSRPSTTLYARFWSSYHLESLNLSQHHHSQKPYHLERPEQVQSRHRYHLHHAKM